MVTETIPTQIESCESKPYHVGLLIQARGLFLGLDPASLRVRRASANCADWTGQPPEALLGRALTDLVCPDTSRQLRRIAAEWRDGEPRRQRRKLGMCFVTPPHVGADALLFVSGGMLCIEMLDRNQRDASRGQAVDAPEIDSFSLYQRIADPAMASADLPRVVCDALQALTGCDRVYFCAFDTLGHGHVRAQRRNEALPDLLDHRFPATDVPQQIRRLLRHNPYRLIADVEAPAVPVLGGQGDADAPLDLTLSACRAVDESHLDYLRNMGARASVSFPVLRGDRLEAIFGGHHTAPLPLSFRQLTLGAQLVGLYQARAEALQVREEQALFAARAADIHALALRFQVAARDLASFVAVHHDALCAVMDADDVLCWFEERVYPGRTLPEEQAASLLGQLKAELGGDLGPWATHRLSETAPALGALCPPAAGALVVALDMRGAAIIAWLRREVPVVETWSGDPSRSALVGTEDRIGPRRSFAAWRREIKGASPPWNDVSLALARQVRHSLAPVLVSHYEAELRHTAERNVALKSAFIAKVSHELRSPLHAIIGFADVLADGDAPLPAERQQRNINIIRESGRRLLRLINDLLDLTKFESGMTEFCLADADIADIVASVVREFAGLARDQSVVVAVEDHRSCRLARMDVDRMRQVIVNLLSNAIRFSPTGGRVVIALATRTAGPDGATLLIEVRDQGVGIPENELDSIFHTFAQSSRTRQGGGGTGLGLTICRKIVEAHRGVIRAANIPTGGARFSVELPLQAGTQQAVA